MDIYHGNIHIMRLFEYHGHIQLMKLLLDFIRPASSFRFVYLSFSMPFLGIVAKYDNPLQISVITMLAKAAVFKFCYH